MSHIDKTFQEIWSQWPWRPIRNCPGRFVLPWTEQAISCELLLDQSCVPQVCSSAHAHDPVLVLELEDGGIISYQQPDGHVIHTLNTSNGFFRKLRHLEIVLSEAHNSTDENQPRDATEGLDQVRKNQTGFGREDD